MKLPPEPSVTLGRVWKGRRLHLLDENDRLVCKTVKAKPSVWSSIRVDGHSRATRIYDVSCGACCATQGFYDELVRYREWKAAYDSVQVTQTLVDGGRISVDDDDDIGVVVMRTINAWRVKHQQQQLVVVV